MPADRTKAPLRHQFSFPGMLPVGQLCLPNGIPCFLWRQEDATTNSLSMLAQSLYASGELHGKKRASLHDMCWRKGRNWNDLTAAEKRGVCVYREEVTVSGRQGPVKRMKFVVDRDIPVFASHDADEWWRNIFKDCLHEQVVD